MWSAVVLEGARRFNDITFGTECPRAERELSQNLVDLGMKSFNKTALFFYRPVSFGPLTHHHNLARGVMHALALGRRVRIVH